MQRWVHEQGWTTLHDAQERAIGPILDEHHDVCLLYTSPSPRD